MASVNDRIAPFDALYAARFGIPSIAATEAVLTIAADLLSRSSAMAARETLAVPTTFIFSTLCQISSVSFSTVVNEPIPALLIKISNLLLAFLNSAKADSTEAASPISHFINVAAEPISPWLISKPKTVAPRSVKPFATSRPIPEPAPVTIATNPENSLLMPPSPLSH